MRAMRQKKGRKNKPLQRTVIYRLPFMYNFIYLSISFLQLSHSFLLFYIENLRNNFVITAKMGKSKRKREKNEIKSIYFLPFHYLFRSPAYSQFYEFTNHKMFASIETQSISHRQWRRHHHVLCAYFPSNCLTIYRRKQKRRRKTLETKKIFYYFVAKSKFAKQTSLSVRTSINSN